jgi:hydrogenase maturation protein HypF
VLPRLTESGMRPIIHRKVPANDGGIALGQVAVAAARLGAWDQV